MFLNTVKIIAQKKVSMTYLKTVITGTGCYIPTEIKTNKEFALNNFYGEDHKPLNTPSANVVERFQQITGIEERRYAPPELNASVLGHN